MDTLCTLFAHFCTLLHFFTNFIVIKYYFVYLHLDTNNMRKN